MEITNVLQSVEQHEQGAAIFGKLNSYVDFLLHLFYKLYSHDIGKRGI